VARGVSLKETLPLPLSFLAHEVSSFALLCASATSEAQSNAATCPWTGTSKTKINIISFKIHFLRHFHYNNRKLTQIVYNVYLEKPTSLGSTFNVKDCRRWGLC
jgi:hypothetical protein